MKVMCLRTGDKYGREYVDTLYRMLARHTTVNFDFECITESQWPGWWGKMDLFPAKERLVFLDLDIVITANVDFLFEYQGEFCAWEDPQQGKYNGSIYCVGPQFGNPIRELFLHNPGGVMRQFYSDQEFITHVIGLRDTWQKLAPGKVKSYKCDRLEDGPGEAAIAVFHGDPKPHTFTRGWVKEHWR
jgi:hypothetical protein